MKKIGIFSILTVIATASLGANAHAFEVARVHIKRGAAFATESRCKFNEYKQWTTTTVDGVNTSTTSTAIAVDKAAIEGLIKQAYGIQLPDENGATEFTNWWVRLDDQSPNILVRANYTDAYGKTHITQDQSPAGQRLSSIIGAPCGFF